MIINQIGPYFNIISAFFMMLEGENNLPKTTLSLIFSIHSIHRF